MASRGLHRSTTWAALVAVVSGAALVASGPSAGALSAPAQADAPSTTCTPVDHSFTPTSLTSPRVVGQTRVLALGRDEQGVPRPPPLTERGKWQFAWDRASRIRPGGPQGVVRLTAHTYPGDGSPSPALGNLLLDRLRVGRVLEVSGSHGERLCYRVVRQVEVRPTQSLSTYYSSTGPSRLAILVCSGTRRGRGEWSHRTIWYAAPTPGSATQSSNASPD